MTRREVLKCSGLALAAPVAAAEALPGTQPLTWDGDLSVRMMDGAHRFVERKIAESVKGRRPDRRRFAEITGVVDAREPAHMERFGDDGESPLLAETAQYRVYRVRWPVLDGVFGEGLLAEPAGAAVAHVVAPTLVDRTSRWSGHADIKMTDQPHRDWAFHMGRHIIGYEVQKVLAAVDCFARMRRGAGKIGVAGYGEGGLLAF